MSAQKSDFLRQFGNGEFIYCQRDDSNRKMDFLLKRKLLGLKPMDDASFLAGDKKIIALN